jgi:hypothetical protein
LERSLDHTPPPEFTLPVTPERKTLAQRLLPCELRGVSVKDIIKVIGKVFCSGCLRLHVVVLVEQTTLCVWNIFIAGEVCSAVTVVFVFGARNIES